MPEPMRQQVLDLGALRKAAEALDGGLALVGKTGWFDQQSPIVQDMLIAGVIQHFEFVYELSIKMIRRRIEVDSDSPDEVDKANFRDLLRIAGEKGLVADVEAWFGWRKTRNISAHAYDREIAHQVYADSLKFINDARLLLTQLEARNA
jgi:nucleotidyltransferase substrate binding protein (TIGR01987 family)